MEDGAPHAVPNGALRASRLEIADANGVVRAVLGMDVKESGDGTEAPCLRLLREDGTVAVDLGFFKDRGFEEPLLNLYARDGHTRIQVAIHPFEQHPHVSVYDRASKVGVSIAVSQDDEPSITLADAAATRLWTASETRHSAE